MEETKNYKTSDGIEWGKLPFKTYEAIIYGYDGNNNVLKIPSFIDINKVTQIGILYVQSLRSIFIPQSVEEIIVPFFGFNDNLVIFCEAKSKPADWCDGWNSGKWPVVWDCMNNQLADDGKHYRFKDHVADNGLRYIIKNNVARVAEQTASLDLEDVVIPYRINNNKVVGIEDEAFSRCQNIKCVKIPEKLTEIGYRAFSDCKNLFRFEMDAKNEVYMTNGNCIIEKKTQELVVGCKRSIIPRSVKSIGDAFGVCKELTSLYVPMWVGDIYPYATAECINLTNLRVNINNPVYESVNNCIIEKQSRTLVLGCKDSIIPNDVINIGSAAFFGSKIKKIDIPASVKKIGSEAFNRCGILGRIKIPSSVVNIGPMAFGNCDSLMHIYCEAESRPSGWHEYWTDRKSYVKWGYKEKSKDFNKGIKNLLLVLNAIKAKKVNGK